jgi:hypothetical protein
MKKIILSMAVSSLLVLSSAQAFDDKREVFIVGVGAGYSFVDNDVTSNTNTKFNVSNKNAHALATSFKIGYGFNEQFSVYYFNDVSWFRFDADKADDTYTSGISGIGGNYYLDPCGPWYITAGIGMGSYGNFSEKETLTGGAFMLGAGYEVAPHMQVEGKITFVGVDEDGAELGTASGALTLNYLWY